MSSRLDRIEQQRQDKLNRLKDAGINPYPYGYHRSHTTQEAIDLLHQNEKSEQPDDTRVAVAGRIMAMRNMGKLSFLDVHDSTGKIQLLFNKNILTEDNFKLRKELDIGDIIGATGTLFRTKTQEPTIQVEEFVLLAKSLQPLPEKWHGLVDVDTRYRQRYLDLIANSETKITFRLRSQIITALRQFMNERGFIEVDTPILQPEAGGALAKPFTTHHNTLDRDFYLRIATELHLKRLIIGGFDKVYELGRIFRNEGIDTKHNPEFTTMESYEAYVDYNDVMKMVEDMVYYISQKVLGADSVQFGNEVLNLKPPWPRIPLREIIREYSGIDYEQYPTVDSLREKMQAEGMEVDPKKNWGHLVDELLSTFVEPKLIQPTFLIDYPVSLSPLAKTKPDNENVVERFEAFSAGMEIANAFTELNDPLEQRERFIQQQKQRLPEGEDVENVDEDFLLALEYGMPPTGGLGVGIDRLVMLLTNQQSIREVILFPQLKEKPSE